MVERYRFWCQDSDAEISREPNGGWVSHSDYEALKRELAEARAEYLTASKDAMELAGELNAAEAERDRLAADNARLRDGFAEPDVMAMSNGVISLHYEDLEAAQSAFDWLEAHGAGAAKEGR